MEGHERYAIPPARKYTSYPVELRRKALQMTKKTGAQVARELGVPVRTVYHWRTKTTEQRAIGKLGMSHGRKSMLLRRALTRAIKERDILKKAAAFFAKESE